MAIILPALLTFLLGTMDFGRLMFSNTMLSHAVEVAARCYSVNTTACATTALTQSYAASQAFTLNLPATAFTATAATCGAQVVGTMNFSFVIPWYYATNPFGASNVLVLTATACYPT